LRSDSSIPLLLFFSATKRQRIATRNN